jgi:diaminohydroxyphosphoribosylaminopyrimidine deaminase/5-amino-6-(5-phosphoribosylamino)uracil reductase
MTDPETRLMRRAMDLARAQKGRTGQNPSVGCVLVDAAGRIVAEGATGDGGRPHAEQQALTLCAGQDLLGGTAYVTLEPCHLRSTGEASCAARLAEAGLRRVVIAARDRHPQGRGGLEVLTRADVAVTTGLLGEDAENFYRDFFATLGGS